MQCNPIEAEQTIPKYVLFSGFDSTKVNSTKPKMEGSFCEINRIESKQNCRNPEMYVVLCRSVNLFTVTVNTT